MKHHKIILFSAGFLLLLLFYGGCDEDVESEDYGSNICTGDCTYCPVKPGYWCTGTTGNSANATCNYCLEGQRCDADFGVCR